MSGPVSPVDDTRPTRHRSAGWRSVRVAGTVVGASRHPVAAPGPTADGRGLVLRRPLRGPPTPPLRRWVGVDAGRAPIPTSASTRHLGLEGEVVHHDSLGHDSSSSRPAQSHDRRPRRGPRRGDPTRRHRQPPRPPVVGGAARRHPPRPAAFEHHEYAASGRGRVVVATVLVGPWPASTPAVRHPAPRPDLVMRGPPPCPSTPSSSTASRRRRTPGLVWTLVSPALRLPRPRRAELASNPVGADGQCSSGRAFAEDVSCGGTSSPAPGGDGEARQAWEGESDRFGPGSPARTHPGPAPLWDRPECNPSGSSCTNNNSDRIQGGRGMTTTCSPRSTSAGPTTVQDQHRLARLEALVQLQRHWDPDNTHHGLLLVTTTTSCWRPGVRDAPPRDMEIGPGCLQGSLCPPGLHRHRRRHLPRPGPRMSAGTGTSTRRRTTPLDTRGLPPASRKRKRATTSPSTSPRCGSCPTRTASPPASSSWRSRTSCSGAGSCRWRRDGPPRRASAIPHPQPLRRPPRRPPRHRPERRAPRGPLLHLFVPGARSTSQCRHPGGRRRRSASPHRRQRVTALEPSRILVWRCTPPSPPPDRPPRPGG